MAIPDRWRREVVLGPLPLTDGVLTMRTPRLGDGAEWSTARIANRRWLERAFPAWGDDWEAEQDEVAWVERWWRLRRAARHHDARPFVLLLDGRLIGELGIDAVDAVSGSGEASVWMVRDHGSAAVMNGASLLLIAHVFGGERPMDRLISPVATTSRAGRTPGLTAVGFRIEATVPRAVGHDEPVDHDIWVLANSAKVRHKVTQALTAMSAGAATTSTGRARPTPSTVAAAARAGLRGARRTLRQRRIPAPTPVTLGPTTVQDATVTVTPAAPGRWEIRRDDVVAGTVRTASDLGTATGTIVVDVPGDASREVVAAAIELVIGAAPDWAPGAASVDVRVLGGGLLSGLPDAELLTGLGLRHTATYEPNPEGRSGWPGEQRWTRDLSVGPR